MPSRSHNVERQDSLLHWRPVLRARQLRERPVEIMLFGREIALYRDSAGRARALDNRCPHRKMRLALGRVEGDQLVCPYHGWRFSPDGTGHSPGTPNMRVATECFEVEERAGAIWLRAPGGAGTIPGLCFEGYRPIALLHHRLDAPLHLLLDNMMELEHTAGVHSVFGFEHGRLDEVKTSSKRNGSRLEIYYEGPQRGLPLYLGATTGIRRGDRFVQYASVGLAPAHAIYDLEWYDPKDNAPRALKLKFVIYFNEVSADRGEQVTFAYARAGNPWVGAVLAAFGFILGYNINRELSADIALVESLRLAPGDEASYRHGRFDRPLLMRQEMESGAPRPVVHHIDHR